MMQRLLELDRHTRTSYDVTSLRVVAASGSALPGELATRFMDAFGDVLYNLYGSTEVAYATVASPADLREAPGTAGRPLAGTTIKLVDATGEEVAAGRGRPDLRRQRAGLQRLHRRRGQGPDRRLWWRPVTSGASIGRAGSSSKVATTR